MKSPANPEPSRPGVHRSPDQPPQPDDGAAQPTDEREGATEGEVGDLAGPGAGYDNEPEQEKDTGGVS